MKKANIESFINNLRNELHAIWDECFYSAKQRESFQALHSIDFTEDLLEQHEAELENMKAYLEQNRDLFVKVKERQEVCLHSRLFTPLVSYPNASYFYVGLEQVHGARTESKGPDPADELPRQQPPSGGEGKEQGQQGASPHRAGKRNRVYPLFSVFICLISGAA